MADENKPQEMEDQLQDEGQAQDAQTDQAPANDDEVIAYGEPSDGSGGGKP